MTIEERIKGRKIGIVGMARSGLAAAVLAESMGGIPFVSDSDHKSKLIGACERLATAGIEFETGGHSSKLLDSDYLVVSPGVPLNIDILKQASQAGIPIFAEIEFASWLCESKIIAVTGSNGKTTTTTLLGEIFTKAGFDVFVGGNIGRPFSEFVKQIPANGIAILELSNFQLESISDFKPDTAMILNLTPDHLDRHGTFDNYVQAKLRITENQTSEDFFILNQDDKTIASSRIETEAQVEFFSTNKTNKALAYVKDNILYGRYSEGDKEIIKTGDILIPGPHNLQNASACVCTALLYDIQPEIINSVLKTFLGVEHRMENVGDVAGIKFLNDSKATNVDSVCYALRSIDEPIYLIAGGRDKNSDFNPIVKHGKNKIKAIVAIGEAKEKIFQTLGPHFPIQLAESMNEAVHVLFEQAIPGEVVMLSPGCASFDMYENFEQRGRAFKDAVAELKNGKGENETLTKK